MHLSHRSVRKEERALNGNALKISLAAARVNAKLTQSDVARKLGKTKQTIVNWENGRTVIDTANFTLLSEIYGIPHDNIFLPNQSS